jgi:hypothetical protein
MDRGYKNWGLGMEKNHGQGMQLQLDARELTRNFEQNFGGTNLMHIQEWILFTQSICSFLMDKGHCLDS